MYMYTYVAAGGQVMHTLCNVECRHEIAPIHLQYNYIEHSATSTTAVAHLIILGPV